jgi:hypothetical protein
LGLVPAQPTMHGLTRHVEAPRHLHDRNPIADHRRLIPLLHGTHPHQHVGECRGSGGASGSIRVRTVRPAAAEPRGFDRPGRLPSGWMRMSSPSSRTRIRLGRAVRFSYPADDAPRVHGVPRLARPGTLDAAAYSAIAPVTPEIARSTGTGPALIAALGGEVPRRDPHWVRRRGPGDQARAVEGGPACLAGARRDRSLGFIIGDSPPGSYFAGRFFMGLGSGGVWIGITFGTLERWPGCEYLCMSAVWPL